MMEQTHLLSYAAQDPKKGRSIYLYPSPFEVDFLKVWSVDHLFPATLQDGGQKLHILVSFLWGCYTHKITETPS